MTGDAVRTAAIAPTLPFELEDAIHHVLKAHYGYHYAADARASLLADLSDAILKHRTALALPVEQPAGWQPIETAPKDTTVILLFIPTRWNKWTPALQASGFWYASGWLLPNADEAMQSVEPTHWMPLQQPPASPSPTEPTDQPKEMK